MGIRFQCDKCGKRLHVKSEFAGKRGTCPNCKTKLQIPQSSTLAATQDEAAAGSASSINESAVGKSPATTPDVVASPPAASTSDPPPARGSQVTGPVADAMPEPVADAMPEPTAAPSAARPSGEAAALAPAADDANASHAPPPIPGTADPIDEEPEAHWYVRPPSGGQFGPAQGYLMRRWMDEGRVAADAWLWREGWEDWQLATDVFAELATPPQSTNDAASTSDAVGVTGPPDHGATLPVDESTSKILAYRRKKARANGCAIAAIVFLSLLAVGLAILLFVILSNTS